MYAMPEGTRTSCCIASAWRAPGGLLKKSCNMAPSPPSGERAGVRGGETRGCNPRSACACEQTGESVPPAPRTLTLSPRKRGERGRTPLLQRRGRRRCRSVDSAVASVALLCLALCSTSAAWAGEAGDAIERVEPQRVRAAVDGALRWLAREQVREGPEAGSWDCRYYRTTVASFAGMAFLANGHLPGQGEYGEATDAALKYVTASMAPDGYLGQGSRSGMYTHAICTLFGLSCLGMLEEPEREAELAQWCGRALQVMVEAHQVRREPIARGGWRYTPNTSESDVSVTSWQLLALHSARQCGFEIDDAIIEAALAYEDSAYAEKKLSPADATPTAGFLYRPGVSREPEPGATGVAVFIKCLLERRGDEKVRASLPFLERFPPSWGGPQYHGYFYFAAFYMTQGMFQIGGEPWEEYAPRMQAVLLKHQAGDGRWPFPPDNARQSRACGPAYSTALGALILSLEQQYLPMYQRQKQIF